MRKDNLLSLLCLLVIASCTDNSTVISSKIINGSHDTLYMITKNWGVTGDNQLTVISRTNDNSHELNDDSTTAYVFKGLDPFVYKFERDTLFLIVRNGYAATVPLSFSSSIKVVQKDIGAGNFDALFMLSKQKGSEYKTPNFNQGETVYSDLPPAPKANSK